MPSLRPRVVPAALWLALWLTAAPRISAAQPPEGASAEELAAARALFAGALRDEEAKRFAEALDKFQRVRAVRDTASVEYRIGACYEGLGQTLRAYAAYHEATSLGANDSKSADVVASARERMSALDKHLARLTLTLPDTAPADTEVRVDDELISRALLGGPVVLEPGPHVITATARNAAPSRSEIALTEGSDVSLTVALESRSPPLAATAPAGPPPGEAREGPAGPPWNGSNTTVGWIAAGGGGALLAASAILAAVRSGDIAKLNQACPPPSGRCRPGSNQGDLESTRSRALVEGPLAIALGAGGLLAAGVGAYMIWSAPNGAGTSRVSGGRIVAFVAGGAGGVAWTGPLP